MTISDNKYLEFTKSVKKSSGTRIHKVKNSFGVYDGFKYYRKNRPKDSIYCLTESQYFYIIRRINCLLGEKLVNGEDINLPCRLGRLELRKIEAKITIDGEKVKTNLPVDWDRTLRLWYEDEESYNNKTLVRAVEKEIYKIYYNKGLANFANKSFYQFNVSRSLKKKLRQNIKEGRIDAFIL